MIASSAAGASAACLSLPVCDKEPQLVIRREIFEKCAFERLPLLQRLHSGPDAAAAVLAWSAQCDPAADKVSHFVLRLALCSTDSLKDWLVTREAALLAHRWALSSAAERDRALSGLSVSPAEAAWQSPGYQVPFTEVPPRWVAGRRVILRAGVAHVPPEQAFELASYIVQSGLREALQWAAGAMEEQARQAQLAGVLTVLGAIKQRCEDMIAAIATAAEADGDGVGLRLGNFEEILQQSFPPCMRHLVMHQRRGAHLQFQGRLQLRPFLRRAGMTLSDALRWWEVELRRDPEVTQAVFLREHRYQIERAYGARGHGRGAHPFGCNGIQKFPAPRHRQAHGCPFQQGHEGEYRLVDLLGHWGLTPVAAHAVIRASSAGKPSAACAEFFRAAHPWAAGRQRGDVRHPNEYLRQSLLAQADRL